MHSNDYALGVSYPYGNPPCTYKGELSVLFLEAVDFIQQYGLLVGDIHKKLWYVKRWCTSKKINMFKLIAEAMSYPGMSALVSILKQSIPSLTQEDVEDRVAISGLSLNCLGDE